MTLGKGWVFNISILVWNKHTTAKSNSPDTKWIHNHPIFNTLHVLSPKSINPNNQTAGFCSEAKTTWGLLPAEAHFSFPDQLPHSRDSVSFMLHFKTSTTYSISQSSYCYHYLKNIFTHFTHICEAPTLTGIVQSARNIEMSKTGFLSLGSSQTSRGNTVQFTKCYQRDNKFNAIGT